jgi:hypothetical protein
MFGGHDVSICLGADEAIAWSLVLAIEYDF